MKGIVDDGGRALVSVHVRRLMDSISTAVDVWIDTGFTGELVLPATMIDMLGLQPSGSVDAILADGSQVGLNTYTCVIEWFGNSKTLEVIANDGECPLLGVGLLLGLQLRIDYRNLRLTLTPAEKDGSV